VAATWREQYERVRRWRKRLQHDAGDSPDDARDTFFAFAQACYHLVDWLEHDASQPIRRPTADAFIEGSAILRACRDICNGSKHARLEAKKVKVKDRPITLGRDATVWALSVEDDSLSFTASWFAALCIAEWNKLLREHGVLAQRPGDKRDAGHPRSQG
jgi:hypothetical protein